jgi:hypothetical protein
MSASYWFSPAPSDLESARVSLDFGLRSADLHFRELVVPELGRIWFARQLSWPVAALALYEELKRKGGNTPKPSAICHGIEALACKLEFKGERERKGDEHRSDRILGRRAFGRDDNNEIWSFNQLRRPANYVRNTHRQAATRALRGLGFASGARFDGLELSPSGTQLAESFLGQRTANNLGGQLRKWLIGWLAGEAVPQNAPTLLIALSPERPHADEQAIVRGRLLDGASQGPDGAEARSKRQRLHLAIGTAERLPDIDGVIVHELRRAGHDPQAAQIVAARAFGAMLDRARDVVAHISKTVQPHRDGIRVAELTGEVTRLFDNLREAAKAFTAKADDADVHEPTCRQFANVASSEQSAEANVRFLVGRVDKILAITDGRVARGPLFRVVSPSELSEYDDIPAERDPLAREQTDRTFRIGNLHSLLRDVEPSRGGA